MVGSSDSLDDLYEALTDGRRRRLLFALLEHNPREVPDDVPFEEQDPDSLRIEMFHCHLPMLEDMGFIEWDPQAHEVVKGPEFETVRPVLETLREHLGPTATVG